MAAEFLIAVLGNVVTRIIDYLDSLLADKYTRHVSIQVMKHAAELDVIAYEDPVFYDRLERARVQATDRLAMIQMLGRLMQQVITTITLSASIIYFSPWLLLLLIAGVLPAFVGESHFAFLGYAKNFRQTPVRRQLDYLRLLGGSKEAAKELKLFGLSKFLTERFTRLSDQVYEENVALSKRKLMAGAAAVDRRLARLLLGLCLRDLADGNGRAQHRLAVLPGGRDSAGQHATSSRFSRRSRAWPTRRCSSPTCWRSSRCSRPSAPSRMRCPRRGPSARLRVSQCFVCLSGQLAALILKNLDFTLHRASGWR